MMHLPGRSRKNFSVMARLKSGGVYIPWCHVVAEFFVNYCTTAEQRVILCGDNRLSKICYSVTRCGGSEDETAYQISSSTRYKTGRNRKTARTAKQTENRNSQVSKDCQFHIKLQWLPCCGNPCTRNEPQEAISLHSLLFASFPYSQSSKNAPARDA